MAADFEPMNANSLIISKLFRPMFTGLLSGSLKCLITGYETRKPQVVSQSHIPLGYETETEALILRRGKRPASTADL
jgi:hypothetical protein